MLLRLTWYSAGIPRFFLCKKRGRGLPAAGFRNPDFWRRELRAVDVCQIQLGDSLKTDVPWVISHCDALPKAADVLAKVSS